MRIPPHNTLGATGAALVLLLLVIGLGMAVGTPIPAGAAPLADLPTATPIPPTATPIPPTATPIPPTATPIPDDPPAERRRDPTPTATPAPSATPVPPASPTPGPATDLMIEKLADTQRVAPGDTVGFTLRISTSLGSTGVADVVVTDVVPEPFAVIDLASDRGDIIVRGREVLAFPATLAPGETVLIRITARVPLDAAAGTVLNTATVTTSTPGDPPGNNTSSVAVQVTPREVPARLPVTADPNEPSLLMRVVPWLLVGALLIALGVVILIQRRGWPLIRVPVRGIDPGDAAGPPADPMPTPGSAAPLGSATPAVTGRTPQLGPALPPARPPEALPPAPGMYRDEGAGHGA